jgi:hypothetical protein
MKIHKRIAGIKVTWSEEDEGHVAGFNLDKEEYDPNNPKHVMKMRMVYKKLNLNDDELPREDLELMSYFGVI